LEVIVVPLDEDRANELLAEYMDKAVKPLLDEIENPMELRLVVLVLHQMNSLLIQASMVLSEEMQDKLHELAHTELGVIRAARDQLRSEGKW
jgi:hypothetical protein